ncbi:MAG: AAA family ATPase [Gemmatales bacterium]|nr:AAA family ATPase [Gemmatales bacterium]
MRNSFRFMTISWKHVLRAISVFMLVVSIVWAVVQPGFEPILTTLGAISTFIVSFFVENSKRKEPITSNVVLYEPECGDRKIDLAEQRLRVSAAFGSYFTSLLETEESYVSLPGQINCPSPRGQESLPPIQRMFWALRDPRGARVVIIAAEGGMGKSTLAAKIVRCLYEREAVDMILGDSAKSKHADPVSGQILDHTPGFTTAAGLCQRLCSQLGLPFESEEQALRDIRGRLIGRHAIIVVDNLETVLHNDPILRILSSLSNREVRSLVTTRKVSHWPTLSTPHLLVTLNPLKSHDAVIEFLRWHIDRYQGTHPRLSNLVADIQNRSHLEWLIERSGGIPLLLQLLISNVARSSWVEMRRLPSLFGDSLLAYLYEAHWQELEGLDSTGILAREILLWINQQQFENRKITYKRLSAWIQNRYSELELREALTELYSRFLVINRDPNGGNFAIVPSLSEFLSRHERGLTK